MNVTLLSPVLGANGATVDGATVDGVDLAGVADADFGTICQAPLDCGVPRVAGRQGESL